MHVLRVPIAKGFTNRLLWLQQLIIEELQKPESGRVDWIMSLDPSTILLNPNIPLHDFLPPKARGFDSIDIVATKPDGVTVSSSAFFIRVSSVSLAILAKAVVAPVLEPDRDWSGDITSQALQYALELREYSESAIFQPTEWYNSPLANGSDTGQGRLLARYPAELQGRRWKHMHDMLEKLPAQRLRAANDKDFSRYGEETRRFWEDLKVQRE
ncbi:glycosyltransferase family 34 protein [Lophiostoma macrostomum CBS 122681]|uniref:Glycosyltransferase family 34 protein n=1 Tax=Lophiostoma macrostomum CBS 122681 TaxID=1314788 RepID=A0A6A6TJV3_9PLEO|nr:glycosyltransferase family 34 protein [Lophiostoma macrostomum CBS 122681]